MAWGHTCIYLTIHRKLKSVKLCNLLDVKFVTPNTKTIFILIPTWKKHETIECAFDGCDFKTNIYGTCATHKSRKNKYYSWKDFKTDVIAKHPVLTENEIHSPLLESHSHVDIDTTLEVGCEKDTSSKILQTKILVLSR